MKLYTRNSTVNFIPNNVDLSNDSKNVNITAKRRCHLLVTCHGKCGRDPNSGAEYVCVGCDTLACNCDCRCNGVGDKVCGCAVGCDFCSGLPCDGC